MSHPQTSPWHLLASGTAVPECQPQNNPHKYSALPQPDPDKNNGIANSHDTSQDMFLGSATVSKYINMAVSVHGKLFFADLATLHGRQACILTHATSCCIVSLLCRMQLRSALGFSLEMERSCNPEPFPSQLWRLFRVQPVSPKPYTAFNVEMERPAAHA